jgi:hypothetical protein
MPTSAFESLLGSTTRIPTFEGTVVETYYRNDAGQIVRRRELRVPKAVAERRQWNKFGSIALADKPNRELGQETPFLFNDQAKPEPTSSEGRSVPDEPTRFVVMYLQMARDAGWSLADQNLVTQSKNPRRTFIELANSRTLESRLSVRQSFARTAGVPAQSSARTAGVPEFRSSERRSSPPATPEQSSALKSVELPVAPKDGGIHARLRARLQDKTSIHQSKPGKVYVSNVPEDFTEDEIDDKLSELRLNCRRINIVRKPGRIGGEPTPTGSVFLEFGTQAEAEHCISCLDRQGWGYNVISASMARKPEDKP